MGGRGATLALRSYRSVAVKKLGPPKEHIATIPKALKSKLEKRVSLISDEVEMFESQMTHIQKRHKKDYEFIYKNMNQTIRTPDLVLTDTKDKNILLFIKEIRSESGVNVVAIGINKYKGDDSVGLRVVSGRKINANELRRMKALKRYKNILE